MPAMVTDRVLVGDERGIHRDGELGVRVVRAAVAAVVGEHPVPRKCDGLPARIVELAGVAALRRSGQRP